MKPSTRPEKDRYYLNIAKEVAERTTCMSVKIGAIIVRDDQIIATGYIGTPRKTSDCLERGKCLRRELKILSGHRYELCRSVHAEMNAIINAARAGVSLLGGDMYTHGTKIYQGQNKPFNMAPCFICKKMILNAGIKRVIGNTEDGKYKIFNVEDWIKDWHERDMLDDLDLYDAQYYEKEKTKKK
nr:dCMP deaminase family protein [Nanoarchaeota archaeon]